MERHITIRRRNCINGTWFVPDDDNGKGMNFAEMIHHYISEDACRPIGQENILKVLRIMTFEPDIPEEGGGHGIMGTVRIVYETE